MVTGLQIKSLNGSLEDIIGAIQSPLQSIKAWSMKGIR